MKTKLKYLLDTDICIYIAKKTYPFLLKKLSELTTEEIGISIITAGELLYGAQKSKYHEKNLAILKALFSIAEPLPLSVETSTHYGEIRSILEKKGRPIGNNDLWIAAHARCLNVTLITNNTEEFSRVPGLALENWTAEKNLKQD